MKALLFWSLVVFRGLRGSRLAALLGLYALCLSLALLLSGPAEVESFLIFCRVAFWGGMLLSWLPAVFLTASMIPADLESGRAGALVAGGLGRARYVAGAALGNLCFLAILQGGMIVLAWTASLLGVGDQGAFFLQPLVGGEILVRRHGDTHKLTEPEFIAATDSTAAFVASFPRHTGSRLVFLHPRLLHEDGRARSGEIGVVVSDETLQVNIGEAEGYSFWVPPQSDRWELRLIPMGETLIGLDPTLNRFGDPKSSVLVGRRVAGIFEQLLRGFLLLFLGGTVLVGTAVLASTWMDGWTAILFTLTVLLVGQFHGFVLELISPPASPAAAFLRSTPAPDYSEESPAAELLRAVAEQALSSTGWLDILGQSAAFSAFSAFPDFSAMNPEPACRGRRLLPDHVLLSGALYAGVFFVLCLFFAIWSFQGRELT